MLLIALLLLTYLFGAIPWSVWLGKAFFQRDPRSLGDGNPGAANAFRAGGWPLGLAVLLLDFLKALLPVLIARWGLQLPPDQLFWLALMPTLGHAFSIFLAFRGGRALVTWFGVWAGLTLYELPMLMGGAAILGVLVLKNDVQRAFVIPVSLTLFLLLRGDPLWLVALAVAQGVILALKVSVFYRAVPAGPEPTIPS